MLSSRPLPAEFLRDGKEGVDGSSPSEGFREMPGSGVFLCLVCKRLARVGTCGLSLAFPYRGSSHAVLGLCKPIRAVVTPS